MGQLPSLGPAPGCRRRNRGAGGAEALTPGLNWYRANLPPERFVAPAPELPAVKAQTLGVWTSGDAYLTEAQMTGSEKYVSGSFRYVRIDGAGHWMQLEAPDEVNHLLLDFLPH